MTKKCFNTCKQLCKVCMALDLTLTGRELQSSKVRNAANLVLTERSTPHPSLTVTPDQPKSHPDLYPHRRKSLLLHTLMTFNFQAATSFQGISSSPLSRKKAGGPFLLLSLQQRPISGETVLFAKNTRWWESSRCRRTIK